MPSKFEPATPISMVAATEIVPQDITGGVSSVTEGSIVEHGQEAISPGALTTGGSFFQAEIPGDLGELFSDAAQNALISASLRRSASENFFTARNHRYRGHREAWKFNLAMQQLMALVASMI